MTQFYSMQNHCRVLSRIDFLGGGGGELQCYSSCVAAQDMTVVLYIRGILDLYETHAVQLQL